jgi:hypothetical protein
MKLQVVGDGKRIDRNRKTLGSVIWTIKYLIDENNELWRNSKSNKECNEIFYQTMEFYKKYNNYRKIYYLLYGKVFPDIAYKH